MRRAAWLAEDVLLAVIEGDVAAELGDVLAGPLETPDGLRVLAARVAPAAVDTVRDIVTDLRGFLRGELAHYDAATRESIIGLLAGLTNADSLPVALAESLHAVRESLRERLPVAVIDERGERAVAVDALHRVADDEFYVRGWVWERDGEIAGLSAVSPEGARMALLPDAFRFPRPDIADRLGVEPGATLGFACRFRTPAPSGRPAGWVLEAVSAAGRGAETSVDLTSGDPAVARTALVAEACEEWPGADELRERHLMPALTRLQELRTAGTEIAGVEDFGSTTTAPAVSIIVPLYERVDLLEHQLVQFVDDAEMRECELIYVLDSPEQADHLLALARELATLYDAVAFRIATLSANGGVAVARNLGATIARGGRLLFLDSDVLPAGSGWLTRLAGALDAHSEAGAVGPKLVYYDGGVQHAGLAFERTASGREWVIEHPFKGLHASLPAANEGGRVPALTGSCLLAGAATYRELDGMRPMYVQGDYEDADFCLRLRETGRKCVYAPEVLLHHLEAQSYPPEARAQNRRYNRWLFTHEWGEALARA